MNHQVDVYRRLESAERFGIKLGLDQIRTILNELGQPQDLYPSILIAGTNGKGSVSAMMQSIFSAHDIRTGLYSSPHLVDVRERIRVDGEMVTPDEFIEALTAVFSAVDRLMENSKLENMPTHFEILTAGAFYHFGRSDVDWAVVEVGMGGRFDATNVLQQKLSIVTTIDFDHQEFLGKSLGEIAFEKAGIFKPGIPVVTGILPEEAASVMSVEAAEKGCPLESASESVIHDLRMEDGFPEFEYLPWRERIRINLRGRHQASNAAITLLACDVLHRNGVDLKRKTVIDALNSVRWPGRLEILSRDPVVLVDSAHNPMGVRTLDTFLEDTNRNQVVVLFTAMKDKNIPLMLKQISKKVEMIFLTRVPPENRCASSTELSQAAAGAGMNAIFEENPEVAFERAKQRAVEKNLPLVIFGSIYLIGRISGH